MPTSDQDPRPAWTAGAPSTPTTSSTSSTSGIPPARPVAPDYAGLVAAIAGVVWEADARTLQFTFVSQHAARLLGYPVARWLAEPEFWVTHLHPEDRAWAPRLRAEATAARRSHQLEYRMVAADSRTVWVRDLAAVGVEGEQAVHLRGVLVDVTDHKALEATLRAAHTDLETRVQERTAALVAANEALRAALAEARQRQADVAALLVGARAVLEHPDFPATARALFVACREALAAGVGYLARLRDGGRTMQLLCLDSGGAPCHLAPWAAMSVRGLHAEAAGARRAVYENAFPTSAWADGLPPGHVGLENVLVAPLVLQEEVVGLLGLANKAGGFTDHDARLAMAFGELSAIALANSRSLEALAASEERFRAVAQSASDAIITVDRAGTIVFWNEGAETIFGYAAGEAVGQPLSLLVPSRLQPVVARARTRLAAAAHPGVVARAVEGVGWRKGGAEVPLELSVATWTTRAGELFFTGIARDVTARKAAEAERAALLAREQAARAEAEAALQLREEFLAVAAHELRTPITSLQGFAQVLLRQLGSAQAPQPERLRQALARIDQQAARLARLVQHVLDASRLEAGTLVLRRQPTDLAALVQRVVARVWAATQRGVAVHAPAPVVALVDPVRLEQVVANLVENALRFSQDERPIEVDVAQPAPAVARLVVQDRGVGVPPEHRGRIFERFYRAHRGPSVAGLGLGLYVSRQLVDLHGGSLDLESPPDGGARFVVLLPAAGAEHAPGDSTGTGPPRRPGPA